MMNTSNTNHKSNISNTDNMSNTKHTKERKHRLMWVVAMLLCVRVLFPNTALAQIMPMDIPTLEALIYDHKQQRSLLLVRATLEESNKLLHKASQVTNREYKDINIELDKYTRAFDIIDLVYNTVSTGFNVYRTYENVSEKIGKYKNLLEAYNEKILQRGLIETADTLLLTVNFRAVQHIAEECKHLYTSVCTIALYATGKVCCTTASMMAMVTDINNSLERIKAIVNNAYYQTWKFIQARTSYWKRELYRSKTIRQLAHDAFGRWIEAGSLNY